MGDPFDLARLADYLRERLGACGFDRRELATALQASRFAGGHSNLTYLLAFGPLEFVMRRPPAGPLPPAAHDVAREYRWLSALHPLFPLAPRPYFLCEDPTLIGAVFYIMERRSGVVLRDEEPTTLVDRPDGRRRVSEALVDALVDLHAIDVCNGAVASLGKPGGFLERQVRGWTDRWHRAQTTPQPEMDAVARWLAGHLPPEPRSPSVVHGDYKLDNVLLDEHDLSRVVGVLDWEMAALGDPLTDLAVLLTYWTATGPPGQGDTATPLTERPGWLTSAQLIERYATRSGRDVSGIHFYEVFAIFKVAVVIQQIFHRYSRGDSTDRRFAHFDARVAFLAAKAADSIGRP